MAERLEETPEGREGFHSANHRGANGYFQAVRQAAGQWWLLDPEGRPFYLKAVNGVAATIRETDFVPAHDPAVRLRKWGFNATGTGGDGSGRDDGLPFLGEVNFCEDAPLIVGLGVRLPDVFDPGWNARVNRRALTVCAALATTRELVGWVTDDRLAWGQPSSAGHPGLLQVCLSLEPSFAAYHAAWEFVLALHGGRVETVGKAWGLALANKEVVRELTRSELGIGTRGYLRDEARWTREFAGRYFTSTTAAVRAVDLQHLILGCRFPLPAGAHVLAALAASSVDVALPHWHELPLPGAVHGPVIAAEVAWSDEAFWAAATGAGRSSRLTSVERMLRRGRTVLKRLTRHPAVMGYVWSRWHDEPGEQPPFARGLVHVNGTEAREHTELLADFNARADALRRGAAKSLSP